MITLLTDFGVRDHFTAAMKGVIASIAPGVAVADATHEIEAFDIRGAAFVLDQYWRYYPAGTVHVAVVDPGVGSARLPLALSLDGHYFVGPDNGVFSFVLRAGAAARVLENGSYFRHPVSQTFHGRDIFAPVAAHLSLGVDWTELGPELARPVEIPLPPGGSVLHVDRYGNLITSYRAPLLEGREFRLMAGGRAIERLIAAYANCARGELAVIQGSSGYYEIILPEDSAARGLGLRAGDPLELECLSFLK
jgi:S-adenosyl-L-methionine hydrolase (adenosine-forming)